MRKSAVKEVVRLTTDQFGDETRARNAQVAAGQHGPLCYNERPDPGHTSGCIRWFGQYQDPVPLIEYFLFARFPLIILKKLPR